MLVAWLVRSRTDAEAEAARASVPAHARGCRRTRTPSLLRDLSLIALGLLIVSSIPLDGRARQPRVRAVRARARGRGRRAVRRVALRVPRPRDPLPVARRRTLDGVPVELAVRRAGARLADPAVLLHHLGRLHELAGRGHPRDDRAAVRRRRRGRHLGRAVLHLHRASRCCAATSRTGRRTCCRRSCSSRSSGSSAIRRGDRC